MVLFNENKRYRALGLYQRTGGDLQTERYVGYHEGMSALWTVGWLGYYLHYNRIQQVRSNSNTWALCRHYATYAAVTFRKVRGQSNLDQD
jgi:hypothetical protein